MELLPGFFCWVEPGDTLPGMARQFYGSPHLWPVIYYANLREIPQPTMLVVGQLLYLPPKPVGKEALVGQIVPLKESR